MGRTGRVQVSQDTDGQVWVGGRTITLFEGTAIS
jgi:predicted PhzF superfamily epimerase YddE/YHI9